jgi:hypothetical protein
MLSKLVSNSQSSLLSLLSSWEVHNTLYNDVSSDSFWLGSFSDFPWVLMTLKVWMTAGHVFCSISLNWVLMFSSWLNWYVLSTRLVTVDMTWITCLWIWFLNVCFYTVTILKSNLLTCSIKSKYLLGASGSCLASQEADIRRITVRSQPRQIVH